MATTKTEERPGEIPKEVLDFSTRGSKFLLYIRSRPGKAVDRKLVRWTGHSFINWAYARNAGTEAHPTLLLTTIGTKTGELRSVVLPYFTVDGDMVVVGSNGGGPRNPMWVGNLLADPHCWLHINRRAVPATAEVTSGDARTELFAKVAKEHAGLERYQDKASTYGRDVPLVVLTPRSPS